MSSIKRDPLKKSLVYILLALHIFFTGNIGIFFENIKIESVNAATNSWDFSNISNYTRSNTTALSISGSIMQLEQDTLSHTGVIFNGTIYNGAYDVVVEGNYAYMTSYLGNRVNILDISNPASPSLVGSILNNGGTIRLGGASSLVKDGNYLYVTSYTGNAVQIINVTNPASPTAAGQVFNATTLAGARGITKVGNYIYVTSYTYRALHVIDVTNPAAPSITGTYRNTTNLNGASEVKISGNYAYVSAYTRDAFNVINITNPAAPVYVTQLRDTTNLNGARDVAISGNYAYVSAYLNNSVRVIDISNPLTPTAVTNISGGSFLINGPRDLEIDGNKLFIAGYTSNAVSVADISTPTSPTYVTSIVHNAANPLLQAADGLFKIGDYLYVASYTSDAIEILKWQYNPTSPFVTPISTFNYGTDNITNIVETLGAGNQGNVTYQISKNGGTTWYYWTGAAWATTTGGVANSTSISLINANITSFNALAGGTGVFSFKAFFTSNGNQKVELDTLTINTAAPIIPGPGGVASGLNLWLKSNAGTSTTTDGANLTTWNDQSTNTKNATAVTAPTYRNNATDNINFYPVVNFNGTNQSMQNITGGMSSKSYFAVVIPTNTTDGTTAGGVPFGLECTNATVNTGTCGLPFGGVVLGSFTAAIPDEVVTHALGSSTNWRSADTGTSSYAAGKPMLISVNENATANGTDIYEKGVQVNNYSANPYQSVTGTNYSIGGSRDPANPFYFNGKVAEVINFNNRLSNTDRAKVESYLSLKYGITMSNGTQNYVASDSSVIWNSSTAGVYNKDIFGIGRDDLQSLGQVQSKSVNNGGVITIQAIGEGTNITPTFVDISDKEFFTVGNNGGSNTWSATDKPVGYVGLTRRWKAQEVGDVGTMNLDFNVADTNFDIPNPSLGTNYYFMYDSNNNGLLSDEVPSIMTNLGGNIWRASGININNNQIFTIASQASTNNIPTNISLTPTSINENLSTGATVGSLSTTDADPLDTHTYSLVTGIGDTDNSYFSVSGTNLLLNHSADYEIKNSYSIRIQTDDGNGGQFQKNITVTINNIGEASTSFLDFENTLNNYKYIVTSGSWSPTTTNPYAGTKSMQSNNGGVGNTQSCFEVTHNTSATGSVSFYYNVSSQAGADFLEFYIDNVQQGAGWSGTVPWTQYTTGDNTAGSHTYKWCYIKDATTNTGTDSAFIDNITFINTVTDTTAPTISSSNFASGSLLPGGNQTISINYNDAESGINTSSASFNLYKWNGTAWGGNIAGTGMLAGTITSSNASYPMNSLSFGKYLYGFQISDNAGNTSTTGAILYIDQPEFIISSGSIDIGNLNPLSPTFSDTVSITVLTVGAGFQLSMDQVNPLSEGTYNIPTWNGVQGFGYEASPFAGNVYPINTNELLATQLKSININGLRNSYTYNIKLGALVDLLQETGNYEGKISFGIHLNY